MARLRTAFLTTRTIRDGRDADDDDAADEPQRRTNAMIEVIAVLLFFGLDIALVVLALHWLSERRAMDDVTDLRHRGPPRYR